MPDGIYIPKVGLGYAPAYQVSGIPYCTASMTIAASTSDPTILEFPSVTKSVTIFNPNANQVHVSISLNGMNNNRYAVVTANNGSLTWDVKVKDIFLRNSAASPTTVNVLAELTGIERNNLPNNWTGSVGVG